MIPPSTQLLRASKATSRKETIICRVRGNFWKNQIYLNKWLNHPLTGCIGLGLCRGFLTEALSQGKHCLTLKRTKTAFVSSITSYIITSSCINICCASTSVVRSYSDHNHVSSLLPCVEHIQRVKVKYQMCKTVLTDKISGLGSQMVVNK